MTISNETTGLYITRSARTILIGEISDAHKDYHGFRPRRNWDAMSMEQLTEMRDDLYNAVSRELREEEEAIEAVCASQGIDRDTYNRWMSEAGLDEPDEWGW